MEATTESWTLPTVHEVRE